MIALDTDLQIYAGAIDIAILAGKANSDIKVNLSFESRAENNNRAQLVSSTKENLVNGIIESDTLYIISNANAYKEHIESGAYHLFKVDGQYLLLENRYNNLQLTEFEKSGTFEVLDASDIVE